MFREIQRAIDPKLRLINVLQAWPSMTRRLAENPRQRRPRRHPRQKKP